MTTTATAAFGTTINSLTKVVKESPFICVLVVLVLYFVFNFNFLNKKSGIEELDVSPPQDSALYDTESQLRAIQALINKKSYTEYLFVSVGMIKFLYTTMYNYTFNKDLYIRLVKCIGNALRLFYEAETYYNETGEYLNTNCDSFERCVMLVTSARNCMHAFVYSFPPTPAMTREYHNNIKTFERLTQDILVSFYTLYYLPMTVPPRLNRHTRLVDWSPDASVARGTDRDSLSTHSHDWYL